MGLHACVWGFNVSEVECKEKHLEFLLLVGPTSDQLARPSNYQNQWDVILYDSCVCYAC